MNRDATADTSTRSNNLIDTLSSAALKTPLAKWKLDKT